MKTALPLDFSGQYIYAGVDVHLKNWQVSVCTEHFEHKTFTQPPSPDLLIRYLNRTFPGASYRCAYEAGFSGFWLQRALQSKGVETIVVHPPDIPTTDKERRYKRNKTDARKLARELRADTLTGIYVPSEEQLADRALVRTRYRLVQKQTRVKNQIKSYLYFFGITIPDRLPQRYWSSRFVDWLRELAQGEQLPRSGALTLQYYLDELHHLRQLLLRNTRAVRALSRTERYRQDVEHLVTLSGIGVISAMTLLVEIVSIERFRNPDALANFVGLVPTTAGSGEDEYEGALTRRRSAQLRRILIESAWVAARKDPVLMEAFLCLTRRMPKNQAIIRVARKQLARIRFVLKHQCPYQAVLAQA